MTKQDLKKYPILIAIMEIKGEVEEVRVKTDGTKIVITVDSLEDGVDFGMLVGMQVVIKEE